MNVYQIGRYFIASPSIEKAYCKWADESNELDFLFDLANIEEGESWTEEITVRRLTTLEIEINGVPCCNGGCNECKRLEENVYISFKDIIGSKNTEDFPYVIAIEE